VILDKTKGGFAKVDLNSEAARRMLEREFKGPNAVLHPNLVRVYKIYRTYDEAGRLGRVDVIMQRVPGVGDGPLTEALLTSLGLAARPPGPLVKRSA
jgi:hypothetical protein